MDGTRAERACAFCSSQFTGGRFDKRYCDNCRKTPVKQSELGRVKNGDVVFLAAIRS